MKDFLDLQPGEKNMPSNARVITGVLIGAALIGVFWAGYFPVRGCHDTWWHIKTGEYLVTYFAQNGFHFPPYDVFTYTGEKTPWVNHEWLGELVIYGAYTAGGLQAATLMKSLVLVLTFGLLILYQYRLGISWALSAAGSMIALLIAQFHLFLRPFIFTYLFIAIFLHLILYLQRRQHPYKVFTALVLGEVVWINLHGGGLLGIVLVGIWWVSEIWAVLYKWLQENIKPSSLQQIKLSTAILICVILASFVNPWGYHTHLLPGKVNNDAFLTGNIGEMLPADFHYAIVFEYVILGFLFLLAFQIKSITVFDSITIIFFAHQALNHMRHMPLFALTAVPLLMKGIAELRLRFFSEPENTEKQQGFWGTCHDVLVQGSRWNVDVMLGFFVIAYLYGWQSIWLRNINDYPYLVRDGYIKKEYPDKACSFILYNKIPGRMFNHDNFSGYLIWRLSPEFTKIWTDTRYDLWGSQYMKEELGVLRYMDIPLGFYDKTGGWINFNDYKRSAWGDRIHIFTRDDITFLFNKDPYFSSGQIDDDFMNWYKSGKPYWKYVLDKYEVNYIITYGVEAISRYLKKNYEGWILIFEGPPDEWYTIHIRNTPENQELIRKYGMNHKQYNLKESADKGDKG